MVGGGAADAITFPGPRWVLLSQFPAIPVFDSSPAGPNRRGGMVVIGAPPTVLPREQRSHTGSIDHPTRGDRHCAFLLPNHDRLLAPGCQLHFLHGGRAQEF